MQKENVWLITAKTNLHVGDENTSSYGLIDKAIQRDALTNLPCINSSSLKGAINEWATNDAKISDTDRISIFGCDKADKKRETTKGKSVFFDANIVAIPEQLSDNSGNLFRLVTCDKVLSLVSAKLQTLGISITSEKLKSSIKAEKIDNKVFESLCSDDNLPIIARNRLENGESTNLWYEQILPAETVLLTVIDDKGDKNLSNAMNDSIVQIGANATIGYGYCEMKHL